MGDVGKVAVGLLVGKSEDAEAVALEDRGAGGVAVCLLVVDFAVDLDGEPRFGAVEVEHEALDRVLPPEP